MIIIVFAKFQELGTHFGDWGCRSVADFPASYWHWTGWNRTTDEDVLV